MSSITDNGPFLCVEEVVRLFKISRTKAYKEASSTSRLRARPASRPFVSAARSASFPSQSSAWLQAGPPHERPSNQDWRTPAERRTRTH